MTYAGLPVVLPCRALEIVEPESWWELPVQPFAGGDHYHLVVPRRPSSFRADTVITWGDAALPMKELGATINDGMLFIGPADQGARHDR